ncbi:gustatory and odorant receptor 24 [Cryptotermes secundus]|uniref:gustatory and odorant receptor 24 n=1 Tax=Cryptotermes secundus TaxID=105785 RepID=UPI001454C74A|nr:gustatory and odorant receptor 24 [Cryptotermes secundus]
MDTKTRLWLVDTREVSKSREEDPFGLRNLPLEPVHTVPKHYDVFYTNMAPVVKMLRAMGALPIRTLPVDGRASCERRGLLYPAMLWSLCMYSGLLTALWFGYSHNFTDALGEQSFDTAVMGYLDVAYHLIDLAIPLNNWREAQRFASYMTSWTAFQSHYRVVTGRVLEVNFRRRATVFSVLLVIVMCGRETVYQVLENNVDNYLVLLTYWYQALLRDTMGLTWYLLCSLLKKTTQSLAVSFQKDVDTAVRPSLVVARYKGLWLQLSRLVRQTGVATCYTYGFYVLYLFLMLTVSIYGVFSTLAAGPQLSLVYLIGDSIITGIQLFVVCDGASSVSREVGLKFQGRLLDIREMHMSDKVAKEVDAFLMTIDVCPPEINFGGYVTVNRGILPSLGSMLVTYLIVLVQFAMSGKAISNHHSNSTSIGPPTPSG